MKFWQKIFISMLLIFIIVFDIGICIIATHAYRLTLQAESDSALREQETIRVTIQNSITSMERMFGDAAKNEERLTAIMKPLQEYYKKQNVFLALHKNGTAVSSNTPAFSKKLLDVRTATKKNMQDEHVEGVRYLFIASNLPSLSDLTFIYARDIDRLDLYLDDIKRVFIILNLGVGIVLSVSVFLVLRRMTRPIRELSEAAAEIAEGAYDKRASVKSHDELGMLAETFNGMAEAVGQNMDKLRETAEEKQRFIDNLSHEMKTPLTSVLGYAEYLQGANGNEASQMIAAGNLHRAAKQLHALSDKMLNLVYLSQADIEHKIIDTDELLSSLRNIVEHALAENGLILKTSAETPIMHGDETLLLSLLTNLVDNAAKASAHGQTICVRIYMDSIDSDVILEVSDNGRGMPPEETKKIMEPFYRIDKARSGKPGGVGLGLSICQEIATLHSADIRVESKLGEGTTVRIVFTTCLQLGISPDIPDI